MRRRPAFTYDAGDSSAAGDGATIYR
jgi:hypothetical protein